MPGLGETKPTPERPEELFGQTLGVWLLAELVKDSHQSNDVLVPRVIGNALDVSHQTETSNAFKSIELWFGSIVERPRHTREDNLTGECRVNEAKVLWHACFDIDRLSRMGSRRLFFGGESIHERCS